MLAKAEATVLFCLSAGAVGGLKAYPRTQRYFFITPLATTPRWIWFVPS